MSSSSGQEDSPNLAQWVVPSSRRRKKRAQSGESFENLSYQGRSNGMVGANCDFSCDSRGSASSNRGDTGSKQYPSKDDQRDPSQISTFGNSYKTEGDQNPRNNQKSGQPEEIIRIDSHICQTIATFVEVHLQDLTERQNIINQSKSRMNLQHNGRCELDPLFMAQRDLAKLKVRNEQTKAIGTITQLTNYLRELAHIRRQCEAGSYQAGEETSNKLSVLRTNIIQALNDFVLMNDDLDVPLTLLDDFNPREYDFCTDMIRETSGTRPKSRLMSDQSSSLLNSTLNSQTSTETGVSSLVDISETSNDSIAVDRMQTQTTANINDDLIAMERRKREIERLERDTTELRKLFSDFYSLVQTQGEVVSSIEDNIILAHGHVSEGHNHLNKAVRSLTVLLPVTGCITGALIGGPLGLIVGGKVGGITIGCASSLIGLITSFSAQRLCSESDRIKADG